MTGLTLALLFSILVWWASTWLILYLDSLPVETFVWSTGVSGALALGAFYGVVQLSDQATPTAAYLGFIYALAIWAWLEMTYLMGILTGPWRKPCPPDLRGWRRFITAVNTSLYHELAVITAGLVLIAATWQAPNQTAAWTFVVLWVMRWSSKLNIYLGVSNLNEEFFPERLAYLKSFVSRRSMNLLFPISVTVATVITWKLLDHALAAPAGSFAAASGALLTSIMLLGLLEHWFLVLPVADDALWRSAMHPREAEERPGVANQRAGALPLDSVDNDVLTESVR